LPTPDKSIGQIEKEQRILLKEQKSNKNDEWPKSEKANFDT
jgi:hypothetical protein